MKGRMITTRIVVVTLCSAMLAASAIAQETISVPRKPATYVTDRPNVIGPKTQPVLEAKLEKFGKETGNQVVVWIGNTLPAGVTIEEYANASFNLWALGQKGKNNGVLLMLFIKSRKMRIETGDGVRDRLTDARAAEIIAAMREPLRASEYNRAITEATDSIIAALAPPPAPAPQPLQSRAKPQAPQRPVSGVDLAVMIAIGLAGAACIGAVVLFCFYVLRAIVRGFSQGVASGGGGVSSDNNVTVTHNHYRRGWGWGRGSGSSSGQPAKTTIVNRVVDTRSGTSSSSSDDDGGSSSGGSGGGGFSGGGSSSGGGASGSW
jgi:uncharacterized protein